MINKTLFIFFAAVVFVPFSLAAAERDAEEKYIDCIKLAKTEPKSSLETAISWAGLGGGDAAKHCIAVSLLRLKQYKQAAIRLVALADNRTTSKVMRAALLGQAGQAWLVEGNLSQADNVLTEAIKLDPENWDIYVDRAQVAALQKDFSRALRDLDRVLDHTPTDLDALVFRASAKRQLKQWEGAGIDVGRALSMDGDHLEGLLERGILRRLLNDKQGAKTDWLKIIKLSPTSETARIASANIKRLEGPPKK